MSKKKISRDPKSEAKRHLQREKRLLEKMKGELSNSSKSKALMSQKPAARGTGHSTRRKESRSNWATKAKQTVPAPRHEKKTTEGGRNKEGEGKRHGGFRLTEGRKIGRKK